MAALSIRHPRTMTVMAMAGAIMLSVGMSWMSTNAKTRSVTFAADDKPAKAPNVVMVVLDTTRRDRLGCYGATARLTPELDRIAREGVVYEDAYTVAPWTTPSHASLFTGLYPQSHGCVGDEHLWLDDEFQTLAEMLQHDGYETVALSSNMRLLVSNLLQGFQTQELTSRHYNELTVRRLSRTLGAPARWVDKGGNQSLEDAADWLTTRHQSGKPFFMFVNLLEAHEVYFAPRAQRMAHLPAGSSFLEATRLARLLNENWLPMHVLRDTNPQMIRAARALYDSEIDYQDQVFGGLVRLLQQHVDLDNTLLMVTADHGENLGEGGRWFHLHSLSDNLLRIPLIIRWPSRFPAGRRIRGFCETVDILPTVLDAIDKPCPVAGLPGHSLVPAKFVPRTEALAQFSPLFGELPEIRHSLGMQDEFSDFVSCKRSLRTDHFKFIWSAAGKHELFDIQHDRDELNDLAESRHDVVEQMTRRTQELFKRQSVYVCKPSSRPAARISKNAADRIRALGYAQ